VAKRRRYGKGSVYQREDGLWVGSVSLGHGPDGRRRRKSVYAPTREEALAQLRDLQGEDLTTAADLSRETLGEYLDRWLAARKPTLALNTYACYANVVEHHLKPELGAVRMNQLVVGHVQGLLASSQTTDPVTGKPKRSPRMVTLLKAVLRIALDHEGHWQRLTDGVSRKALAVPAARRSKPNVWTDEHAKRFLDAAGQDSLAALWLLAITTGMRQGEMLGLHWADIDWKAGTVHIQRNLVEVDCKIQGVFPYPKTKSGFRSVALTAPTLAALRAHKARLLARGLAACEWVFPVAGKDGPGYWLKGNVRRKLASLVKRAAVPKITFHQLRHTSATLMLLAGVPPKVVQERLGHSKIGTTMDTYAHVLPNMQREAAEQLDAVLGLGGPDRT
jgi:integrase